MTLNQRIECFVRLGKLFSRFQDDSPGIEDLTKDDILFYDAFKMQINRAYEFNGWFTKDNVLLAFRSWSELLSRDNLETWLKAYNFDQNLSEKTVGIVMAGNIPLVGFHDFLSVLITGHKVEVKLSSNDKHFLPLITKFLEYQNPWFKDRISFTKEKMGQFEAVIATGSNNTARYFEHYFGHLPNIIRKNRNSVAVLTGNETPEELELLGNDIIQFFGLGCRSVSKIYVPENYNFDPLFGALYKFKDIINYKKYENNYDYNKAVYMMSLFPILENGFLMLKEDSSIASPIATLFYEYYNSKQEIRDKLILEKENIQCIVSNENVIDFVNFGDSQSPKLWNYADDVDTIAFLLKL